MRYLDKLSNSSKQKYNLSGEDGEQIGFNLTYLPTQQSWSFDITYKNYTINGLLLTVSPNILKNYKNLLPFGIACISVDGLDPYYINDFTTGRIKLYLLNAGDVLNIEKELFQ